METAAAAGTAGLFMMGETQQLQSMLHNPEATQEQKNAAAAQAFEACMLRQILKDSIKPIVHGGIIKEEGTAFNIYRQMMTEAMAQTMSTGGGVGISTMLQHHLQGQTPAKATETTGVAPAA